VTLQAIVAQNIKGFRLKHGFTQENLALKAKLHSNHLARMERGEEGVAASLSSIEKIAKALKIPPHLLLIPDAYLKENL
jgi:XRE family transcriptional regulator, regulator of sulfur utilization